MIELEQVLDIIDEMINDCPDWMKEDNSYLDEQCAICIGPGKFGPGKCCMKYEECIAYRKFKVLTMLHREFKRRIDEAYDYDLLNMMIGKKAGIKLMDDFNGY